MYAKAHTTWCMEKEDRKKKYMRSHDILLMILPNEFYQIWARNNYIFETLSIKVSFSLNCLWYLIKFSIPPIYSNRRNLFLKLDVHFVI